MKEIKENLGEWSGSSKIWLANTTMQVVFPKRLKELGCKPGQVVDIYHRVLSDGRWAVTYVERPAIENTEIKPTQKVKAAA